MDYTNPSVCIIGLDQHQIEEMHPDDPDIYLKALKAIYYCSPDVFVLYRRQNRPITPFEINRVQMGVDCDIAVLQVSQRSAAPANTVWCNYVQRLSQGEGTPWSSILAWAAHDGQPVQHLMDAS